MATQIAIMNQDNIKRENEVSSHRNNHDPVGGEEENNTHETHGREESDQTTTTQGLPIYSGPFSKFTISISLLENF